MLAVAHVLGLLLATFALTYVLPVVCSLLLGDHVTRQFLLRRGDHRRRGTRARGRDAGAFRRELKPRDGFLLVTLGWLLLSGAAALPLLLMLPDLNFTAAFFEAMSGLTTTGSTVLNGLDALPPSVNFWRHALHWFGGLGIIVMALAVLPLLGVGGMQLYKGQAPGPVKDERLAPRITETAKSLWLVYALITAAGIVALRLCGMSWFDAICHAFSAVGLGGFSTHDRSIAYFDSPAIEVVLMVLMVIASLNFARHFIALRRLSLATYRQDPEASAIFAVLSVSVVGIAVLLDAHGVYPDFADVAAPRRFQRHLAGDHQRAHQPGLPAVAGVRALLDAVPVVHRVQHRLDRRRHQDVPHAAARAPGGPRDEAPHPPDRRGAGAHRRPADSRQRRPRGAGVHLPVLHDGGALTFAMLLTGMDFDSSFSAVVACHQQHRARLRAAGRRAQPPRAVTARRSGSAPRRCSLGRLEIFSVLVLFRPAYWRK